jgi:acetolactate synthase-1/2/3 large subunit
MKAADLLVECLRKEEVNMVVGYSGRPILALMQALANQGIPNFLTRHEQGAGFMADGYTRVSNRPGVVLIQRGPGVTNCMTAIANAQIDCIPIIVLIGQGEMEMFGKGALQELDHLAFLPYFTKWAFRVPTVNRIPEIVRRAFTIATSGKPGPVALELPMNLMEKSVDEDIEPYTAVGQSIRTLGDPEKIHEAVEMLANAHNPVIYAGAGILRSEATDELFEFAEMLAVPVMTTLPGKSAFPENHPLSLGIGGFPRATYGTKQAHQIVAKSDCVIAFGTSFREHGTRYFKPMPAHTKLIQVDISETELGKNYPVHIRILGDLRSIIKQMLEGTRSVLGKDSITKIVEERRLRVTNEIKILRKEWMDEWDNHLNSKAVPIDPYRITTELMKILDPDRYIILHDAGLVRAYICHHFVSQRPGSFVGFGGFSSMGYAIPASLGAKIAAPGKEVITVVGDGSFGMTGFEIETAVRYGIKTITLLYNNRSLDAVRVLQKGRKEPFVWETVGGNYAQIAEGMGAFSTEIIHPKQIRPAIEEALRQERPAVLEIRVQDLVPTPNYP